MSLVRKYLNPQNDVAFKRIFGQEKNKDILLALLNAVLAKQIHRPLKEVRFVSPIQEGKTIYQKRSAIDVMCKDQDGCTYIIEMQVEKDSEFRERAQYYAAKSFSNQSKKGDDYVNLKKVIFLAFCNFPIFPEKKDFKSDHQIRDIVTHETDLNKMGFTFVDLSKFKRYETNHVSNLNLEHKFYYFLKYASQIKDNELMELSKSPIIDKAFHELVSVFWTTKELEAYETAEKGRRDYYNIISQREKESKKEGEKIGMAKGEKIGMAKGKKEGKKEGEKIGMAKGKKEAIEELLKQGIMTKEQAAKALKFLEV
jgi:predicted transposase/invertase (TIGR01784 family)